MCLVLFTLVAKVIQFLPHSGNPFHLVTIASVTRDTRVLQETKLTMRMSYLFQHVV